MLHLLFTTALSKMAVRLFSYSIKRVKIHIGNRAGHSATSVTPKLGPDGIPTEHHIYGTQIGTREIVGFGWNGLPSYVDRSDFPLPAIRWREETSEITVNKILLNTYFTYSVSSNL